MKLRFREDPKEWRKSTLLTILGIAFIATLLKWRHHLSFQIWIAFLLVLAVIAIFTFFFPRWFRGYYRLSLRLGFYSSQFVGRCVLAVFFFAILLPSGLILGLVGKDPLRLSENLAAKTYWQPSKPMTPLDRLF